MNWMLFASVAMLIFSLVQIARIYQRRALSPAQRDAAAQRDARSTLPIYVLWAALTVAWLFGLGH